MARYGQDFGASRGFDRNRGGGQWGRGSSWNEYDSDFNRGRFQERGGRFGGGPGGSGSRGFDQGGYGGTGYGRRYDQESFGGGYGGQQYGGGGYGGGNFGRTDFDDNWSGGYSNQSGRNWGRGYSDDDHWGVGISGTDYGRSRGGMGERGMRGRGGSQQYRGGGQQYRGSGWNQDYDQDFGDRFREGWNDLKRGMRRTFGGGGGYDRGW